MCLVYLNYRKYFPTHYFKSEVWKEYACFIVLKDNVKLVHYEHFSKICLWSLYQNNKTKGPCSKSYGQHSSLDSKPS